MIKDLESLISIYLEKFSLEYNHMWSKLAKLSINKTNKIPQLCEHNEEGWQYMGSGFENNKKLFHYFRHRCHPKNSERINIGIKASDEFKEFIKKEFMSTENEK